MQRAFAVPAVVLASLLALAGCSATAPGSDARASATPDSRTNVGVTRGEITLGALTDYSGPFSGLSLGAVHGHQIWADETNAAGGICGRKIKLETRDHQGNLGAAKTQYAALEPEVLGFIQLAGSAVIAALSPGLVASETTVAALPNSSALLTNPYVIIPAATYDIEMINGLSFLMQQGRIRPGDTIGHLWLDGEYGANGLRGAQYFAQRHNLTVRDAKVTATGSDMRAAMTAFTAEPRVTAIALSTTPAQTASAATVNQQLGLNVPMIGNSPALSPQLLTGPDAGALGDLAVVASSAPFASDVPKARHVAGAYQQAGYRELPNSGVTYGYAIGEVWGQLLQRACTNGDLSRAGIQEAMRQVTTISTGKLTADLDFAKPGAPATREVAVGVPDVAVPGRVRQVTPPFMAPEALAYVAPHQSGD